MDEFRRLEGRSAHSTDRGQGRPEDFLPRMEIDTPAINPVSQPQPAKTNLWIVEV